MSGYDAKSCNSIQKPFYRPAEAALRWCGLIAHESAILSGTDPDGIPKTAQFPGWPCLQANTELILDAIENGDLPYGRNGVTVSRGTEVAKSKLTVRHTDLREWMAKHYPDKKPAFLFDEIERKTHAAINADSFLALQADRDALREELEQAKAWAAVKLNELDAMRIERDELLARIGSASTPSERAEATYLNIIGALLALMLGKTPAGNPQSVYNSQAAIIDALLAHGNDRPGISKRTLEEKFAEANRSLTAC